MSSILFLLVCCFFQYIKSDVPEDARLNFTQLAVKYGHECEEFDVVTEDRYKLKIFHITGNKSNPVLLGHGFIDSADTYIARGNSSWAITLANKGYDVWALNVRGSKYGKGHETLNSTKDKAFWDFSFHEMGVKDMPAIIDFVLNKTNQSQLTYIGTSQGTQMTFVLLSMKPEYNAKIKVFIALAPVAYLHNMLFPSISLPALWQVIRVGFEATGTVEINFPEILRNLCQTDVIGYALCARGIAFTLCGSDPPELEPEFAPILFGHYPTSTSTKNADHLSQVALRKKFSQFDYGLKNLVMYGGLEPLDYPLEKISARVVLLVGLNDKLADIKDVNLLKARLPNTYYHEMEHEAMNHIDWVYGKNMKDYLFPIVFDILQNNTQGA